PDRQRLRALGGERDEVGEIVAAVGRIRLYDDPGFEIGEVRLAQQLAEQLQRDVLHVVVLHVEVHERAAPARQLEQRPDACLRRVETEPAGQRLVVVRQRGRLDA